MTSVDRPEYRHPALTEFAPRAKAFCQLVDKHAESDRESFLRSVHRSLAELYLAGLSLPDTSVLFDLSEAETEDGDDGPRELAPDPDRHTHDEWRVMFQELGAFLGERNHYREIFNPYDPPEKEEVIGCLADDISDIYGDVLLGLRHWERGETGEALWEWRFNFESHWSEHVTGALRALNALTSSQEMEWPGPPLDAT